MSRQRLIEHRFERGSVMLKDFRAFITRGNVIDLAVGIIIGAAFGTIVTSLVNDVIMPPIGLIVGGVDFSELKFVLKEAVPATETPEVAIYFGRFINAVINFLIVAGAVFLLVRALARMQEFATRKQIEEEQKELPPTTEQLMLEELKAIRTSLQVPPPSA
jgi:large conductance mechanosensitive channel